MTATTTTRPRPLPDQASGMATDILELSAKHSLDPATVALYQSRNGGPDPRKHRCPSERLPLAECTCGFLSDLEGLGDAG